MYTFNLFIFFLVILDRGVKYSLGQALYCVPAGTCTATTTPSASTTPPGIDPRIVTPTQCPPGQEPCANSGTQCGTRFITNANTADGFSTQGAYPWLAYIQNQTGYTGVGVLLDSTHVLTAAHKVNLNVATPSNVRLSFGVYNPTSQTNVQTTTAASIILHPSFNSTTLMNDIAVIRLAQPINLGSQTGVNTACLPTQGQSFIGRNCTVAGWGQTAFGANDAPTSPQKQVTVPIVSNAACRQSLSAANILGNYVDRYLDGSGGEICAGGNAQMDACTQDGGSPLMCTDTATGRFTIAGLVIWGKRCGQPGVYGVYVSVPFYRSWIDSATIQSG